MKMETRLQARQVQEMRLAPQMIQSMEILQLPAMELQERVQQELEENPVLEATAEPIQTAPLDAGEKQSNQEDPRDDEGVWFERMTRSRGSRVARSDGEDAKTEMLYNTIARSQSLQDYLYEQVQLLDVPEEYLPVVRQIIYNLDDRGYLPYTPEQLAETSDPPMDVQRIRLALRIVQSLEPAGIGASDLKECLLLQLKADPSPDAALARDLVAGHLADIDANRLPKIAKETGHEMDEIKRAMMLIATLTTRPGTLYGGESSPRVVPDVVVEYVDGRYEVRVENHYIPELSIGLWYRKRLEQARSDPTLKDWLRKKMDSAKWLIEAIVQRQDTMQRVASAVIEAQKGFLEHGIEHLAPLKMQQVADAVGVHVSTVSRAISKKYVQTPRGIFPIKFFFSGGVQSASGEDESWVVVRQKVAEVVAKEDKAKPLSDGEISDALKKQGLDVARRTVTKYRKMMKIGSSRARKAY